MAPAGNAARTRLVIRETCSPTDMSSDTTAPERAFDEASTLAFGDCELDRRRRELRRSGQVVALEPKVFELLVFLASRPEEALSKDALQAAVWPGLVVSDSVFSQAIMKARRAVGDDGQQQSVIATVHGYGYRFVAPVRTAAPSPDAATEALSRHRSGAPASGHAGSRRMPRPAAAHALLALLALAAIWLFTRGTGAGPTAIIAVLPSAQAVEEGQEGTLRLVTRALDLPGSVNLVPAENVRRLLDANGVQPDDDARILEVLHQTMGVDYLLRTDIRRRGDHWSTHAVLIDRNLHRTELDPGPGSMVAMVTGLGRELGRTLGRTWPEGLPPSVLSVDEFANQAMARGLQALLGGDSAAAAALFQSALSQDPGLLWARYELAQAYLGMGQAERARPLLEEVRDLGVNGDPRLGAHALTSLGIMAWRAGDLQEADTLFQQAAAVYQRIGHDHGMASVLGNLGILAENRGDFDRAEELYGQALVRFRRAHDLVGESAVYTNTAVLAKQRGRTTDAWRDQMRAVGLQRRLGIGSMLVLSLTQQAELELELGMVTQAAQTLAEARQRAEAQEDTAGLAGVQLAEARRALDDLDATRAAQWAAAARDRYRELGHGPYEARAGQLQALALLELGQADAALALLQDLPADGGREQLRMQRGLLLALGEATSAAAAQEQAARLADVLAGLSDPVSAAYTGDAIARLLRQAGDDAGAIGHWREAIRALAPTDEPHRRAWMQTRLAAALIDQRDYDGAEALLAQVEKWNADFVPARLQRLRLARALGDEVMAGRLARELAELPGAVDGPLSRELAVSGVNEETDAAVPGTEAIRDRDGNPPAAPAA